MTLAEVDVRWEAPPFERRWTLEEFVRLDQLGFFEDKHWELLDGRFFRKMGQNRPHLLATMLATQALQRAFGEGFTVTQNLPYHLGEIDAPEPDIAVFRGKIEDFDPLTPDGGDLALVVEVTDSRMDTAVGPKVVIYARHAVCEYWIIDVRSRTVQVRRDPDSDGYRHLKIFNENDEITPLLCPNAPIPVRSLLPKRID